MSRLLIRLSLSGMQAVGAPGILLGHQLVCLAGELSFSMSVPVSSSSHTSCE